MARRPKGDGSLFKRADGTWIGKVELPKDQDGKRRWKSVSSKDRNEAIRKLKKLRADVDSGRIAVTGNTTVEKWLQRWLKDIHRSEIRPTTYRDYATTINVHIAPLIGSKRLDRLTPEHVRQMRNTIQKTSTRTALKAHIVLKRALKDAMNEGMIPRNVAAVVKTPKHNAETRDPLNADEARHLLRSAIATGDPLATRWAAAFLLGARQGECLGLTWDNVDLDNGWIDISWQLQQLQQEHGCGEPKDGTYPCGRVRPGWCPDRRWNLPVGFEHKILHRSLALTKPKTKAGDRGLPIPAPLWAMLEQYERIASPHDLVWCHSDGRPIGPRYDFTAWRAALVAAGLATVDPDTLKVTGAAPLHAARHTTARLLADAGVSAEERQAILGHASVIVTRGYGGGIGAERKRQLMSNALDQLLALD